jgi:penicillin-binding protein 1A
VKSTNNSQSQPSSSEPLPPSATSLKIRKYRRQKNQRISLTWALLLGVSGLAIAFIGIWQKLESSIPDSVADVSSYSRPNTLTIKAVDGSILKEIGEVSHDRLELEDVPPFLSQAFVASEDVRFYEHHGIDFKGIARAVVANIKAQGAKEGGSTITQQLARIAYLNQEKRIWRKIKEMKIAGDIEANLTKAEILETYLNLVYLGAGSYGVADAAWVYFGKTPQQLTLSEVATLAGIIPAPSIYSPFSNPELATQRRNVVLSRMVAAGYITQSEAITASNAPLTTNQKQPKRLERKSQYFTNYIEKELPKYVDAETLAMGGIVVETTLDPLWQTAAETTVSYGLKQYGKWQKFQEAAIVALDPKRGTIKAMVGGKNFGDNQYNRVTQAQRQPGSTFKTFIYTTAIASGFSPYKTYLDAEFYVDGYKPKNYNEIYRYTYVSLYDAFVSSINTVALQTIIDLGGKPVVDVAQKMGIKSQLQPTYSLSLGAWEVNLLELTNAYGTIANKGMYQEGHGITKISDREGKIIYQADFEAREAIDPDTAAMMTWMLQGVVSSGTGIPAQIGRPSAGKTGTTDKARDLWYVGYIPQVVAGIWLGNDDNQPTNGTSGIAAEMWRKFMLQIIKDIPVEAFPPRPKLTGREVTVAVEPFKPKRKYHLHQAPVYSQQRTYYRPNYYYATPRRTYSNPAPVPAATPAPASASAPAATPAPAKIQPLIRKHNQKFNPANNTDGDWVKERLGRE